MRAEVEDHSARSRSKGRPAARRTGWILTAASQLAFRGVAGVFFGVAVLALSNSALVVLSALLAAYLLASGAFTLVGQKGHSWPLKVGGAVDFLSGMGIFAWPGISTHAPALLVAGWALASGTVQIWYASSVRLVFTQIWPLILGAIASIVFALVLYVYRRTNVPSCFGLIGEYSVVWGEFAVIAAWAMFASRGTGLNRFEVNR